MRNRKSSVLIAACFCLLFAAATFAQSADSFKDANAEYIFDLPNETWKMTVKPSPTSPNVEYVFGTRQGGHFEVRKLTVKPNAPIADLVRAEEDKLQFQPGFVAGKEENFSGTLDGKIFNYEFVRAGQNMSGRFYYLRADATTVYVIRFTGVGTKLRSIRNQTDSIARTFSLKKSK